MFYPKGIQLVHIDTADILAKGSCTGSLRPQRSTWYIVRYPGDDWYWRGYTAVTKVTVR